MFWSKRENKKEKDLDQFGRMVVRASALSDSEAEEAVSSPFLLDRIRARIAEEQKSPARPDYGWEQMLLAARRVLPAMAAVAIIAVGLLLVAGMRAQSSPLTGNVSDHPQLPGDFLMAPVAVCSLSNKEQCAISTNEVIATIVSNNKQEKER
jgi:hypothetical protein